MCGTWLLSAELDFRRKHIWTIPHLGGVHYLHTHQILCKYLNWGQRYAPKRNLKRPLWQRISTSGSNFDNCHPLGTFLCIIVQNFKKITQSRATLLWFNFFLHTFKPTLPTPQQHSATMHVIYSYLTVS